MLHFERLTPTQLTSSHLDAWDVIASMPGMSGSPFMRPEFLLAVAAVRSDIELVIVKRDDEICGIWPYQRRRANEAVPVAGPLNDLHGVIQLPGLTIPESQLLATAKLRRWRFHHLAASNGPFWPNYTRVDPSPYLDLQAGFETYEQNQRKRHPKTFRDLRRRACKLSDTLGPLSLEVNDPNPEAVEELIAWKRDQYRRTGVADVFAVPWTGALLRHLHRSSAGDKFHGQMSVLRAGSTTVAMHYGLRSQQVFHCWFPAYNSAYARWSPGLQLFMQLAKGLAATGVTRVDLGKGDEVFKQKLGSGTYEVAEGVAGQGAASLSVRRNLCGVKCWLKRSPLGASLSRMSRRVFAYRRQSRYA